MKVTTTRIAMVLIETHESDDRDTIPCPPPEPPKAIRPPTKCLPPRVLRLVGAK